MHLREWSVADARGETVLRRVIALDEGARPAVVLAHGAGESSAVHQGFARELAARGLRVELLDLPGFGRSGARRGHVERFDELAEAIGAALDDARAASGGRAALCGHSLGALAAAACAVARPLDVAALVLCSPIFGFTAGLAAGLGAAAGAGAGVSAGAGRAGAGAGASAGARSNGDGGDPLARIVLFPHVAQSAASVTRRLSDEVGRAARALDAIAVFCAGVPVLALFGALDQTGTSAAHGWLASHGRADALVEVVAGAGHNVLGEAGPRARVGEWLASVLGAVGAAAEGAVR